MTQTTAQFYQCIERKLKVLQNLQDAGKAQLQLIERHDSTGLIRLLAIKQQSVDQLIEIEKEIGGYPKWSDSDWESETQRQRCREASGQCNELGRSVLELERACEENAVQQRNMLADQIQELSRFHSRNDHFDQDDGQTHLAAFDESS